MLSVMHKDLYLKAPALIYLHYAEAAANHTQEHRSLSDCGSEVVFNKSLPGIFQPVDTFSGDIKHIYSSSSRPFKQ
jgi:hypothetical protein